MRDNPTAVVRHLLGRSDIQATYLSSGLVRVQSCLPVPSSAWHFIGFNGSCFRHPRVQLLLPSGLQHDVFLDLDTRIILESSAPLACASCSSVIFQDGANFLSIDTLSGSSTPISTKAISFLHARPLPTSPNSSIFPTIFHNLILTNISEVVGPSHLDTWSLLEQHRVEDHLRAVQQHSASTSSLPPSFSLTAFLLGTWTVFDVWTAFCCSVVTIRLPKTLIVLYVQLGSSTNILPRLPPRISLTSESPAVSGISSHRQPLQTFSSPPQPVLEPTSAFKLHRVAIDAQSGWPPRASFAQSQVLAANSSSPFFVAQIPIKVNSTGMLALIDTGAAITITRRDERMSDSRMK